MKSIGDERTHYHGTNELERLLCDTLHYGHYSAFSLDLILWLCITSNFVGIYHIIPKFSFSYTQNTVRFCPCCIFLLGKSNVAHGLTSCVGQDCGQRGLPGSVTTLCKYAWSLAIQGTASIPGNTITAFIMGVVFVTGWWRVILVSGWYEIAGDWWSAKGLRWVLLYPAASPVYVCSHVFL